MKMSLATVILCVAGCFFMVQSATVTTDLRHIEGETVSVKINATFYDVDTYLGIPYAKPPVGQLRFRKPEHIEDISTPFNATKYSPACWQFTTNTNAQNREQSEDCLYVNVFVPGKNNSAKYAVIVYLYGGFEWGASDIFDGKYLSAFGEVIVVTFNNRVGLFGYLRVDDENAPGNLALWDQRLLPEWVNRHIESFGGDKSKVTLLGSSGQGAICATIHALYPGNQGLFQRDIAQSGFVTTMEYNFNSDATPQIDSIIKALGCDSDKIHTTINCLRTISASDITNVTKGVSDEIKENLQTVHLYQPSIDGDLIKTKPRHVLGTANKDLLKALDFFKTLDFLNGFNDYDGAHIFDVAAKIIDLDNLQPTMDDMNNYTSSALHLGHNKSLSDKVISFVMSEYTNWDDYNNSDQIRLEAVRLYTDMTAAMPAIEMSRAHAEYVESSKNTFLYQFSASPTYHPLRTPNWINGANLADELLFVAGMDQFPFASQWEKDLSYKIMTYWSQFAKYGNPNGESVGITNLPEWPKYSLQTQKCLVLDNAITVESFVKRRAAHFWLTLFPELLEMRTAVIPECQECTKCTSTGTFIRHDYTLSFLQILFAFLWIVTM